MVEFLQSVWDQAGLVGLAMLATLLIAYILYRAFSTIGTLQTNISTMQNNIQANKDENQKLIREFAASEAQERKSIQEKLDTTEQSFGKERQAWETERKTLLDERERLIQDLQLSKNNEAETQERLKSVSEKVQLLEARITELERENELAKVEKGQLIRDMKYRDNQIKELRRELGDKSKELKTTNDALVDANRKIRELRTELDEIKVELKQERHDLSQAYGTIATLTAQLARYTEDTTELPDIEIVTDENGDEVVTPILKRPTEATPEPSSDSTNTDDNDMEIAS